MVIAQIPMQDDRKTGYKFLDKVSGKNTLHPGEDLNSGSSGEADNGLSVKPMAAGRVVYVGNGGAGWGNIVVIEHPSLYWISPTKYLATRYAHFKQVNVKVGDEVTLDTVIGLCGKSGTGSSHCHWEVLKKKLNKWTQYPNGWTREEVLSVWVSPYDFVKVINTSVRLEALEEPIVKWHKENKIIEEWSLNPSPSEIRLGYAIYKAMKVLKEGNPSFTL